MDGNRLSRRGVLGTATALAVSQSTSLAARPQGSLAFEVRPEDYGAIADGVTDCSEAFVGSLASINQFAPLQGRPRKRVLRLSSGVYRLTRPLQVAGQDIHFKGSGGQNTALLIDHSGDGINYTGDGDSSFQGLSIISTAARFGGEARANGFRSDPGGPRGGRPRSTIRLELRDFHVQQQPGDGIHIVNPEGLRMETVTSNQNGGSGCVIHGRDIENILNLLDFCRFSENAGRGLVVDNISISIFSRVECLNNKLSDQMVIVGSHNHIVQPDCEAFDLSPSELRRTGLSVSGDGNQITGGAFYKLDVAIAIGRGRGNCIMFPKLDGSNKQAIAVGVRIAPNSENCLVQLAHSNFVTKLVDDAGKASRLDIYGRQQLARPALAIINVKSGQVEYTPDMNYGHTFRFTLMSPLLVLPPSGLVEGDLVTFIVELGGNNAASISFSQAYRGAAKALTPTKKQGGIVLHFIALAADELILSSFCYSD